MYKKPLFKNEIIIDYIKANLNKKGLTGIAKDLSIAAPTVRRIVKDLHLDYTPKSNFNRVIFNENYFEKIDTNDKAYFLGLLYADGNIYFTKSTNRYRNIRSRMQIYLDGEDTYILELFKKYLEFNGPLYKDRKGEKLLIHNKKLVNDLQDKGIYERKSLILEFPDNYQVPEKLIHHFIRGYFDGDGSIYNVKNSKRRKSSMGFTGTESFLNSLSIIFNKLGYKTSKFHKRYKEKEISAGTIFIYISRNVNLSLIDWMYKDCEDLYLKRKYDKFKYIQNEA